MRCIPRMCLKLNRCYQSYNAYNKPYTSRRHTVKRMNQERRYAEKFQIRYIVNYTWKFDTIDLIS